MVKTKKSPRVFKALGDKGVTHETQTETGFEMWLAGVQPVRNTRAVLSMVSASDGILVSYESIIPNHILYALT